MANPSVTSRVANRFIINEEEKIIEPENHVDASDLRNPFLKSASILNFMDKKSFENKIDELSPQSYT